jgi:hypothetical protein
MAKRKKYKRKNNDLQNTTHEDKDREKRTLQQTGAERMYNGTVCCSCCTSGTRRVNLVTNPLINH